MTASQPLLVCLVGAECTGKTTLAQALAQHFDGLWVPEHLRRFTEQHGRTPMQHEQQHVLQEQLRLETQTADRARQQSRRWVFCDTAPLLTAAYSECVFADTSLYPQAQALHARYALTLLLEPDLPWQPDGLQRDGRKMRAKVQQALERALAQQAWPCVRIAGASVERLQAAVGAVLQVTPAPVQSLPRMGGSG